MSAPNLPPPPATAHEPPAPGAAPSFEDGLVDLLRDGPLTGFGIVGAAGRIWPGFLTGREGYIYPVLLQLRREGRVASSWELRPEGRRLVHRATDAPEPCRAAAPGHGDDPPPEPALHAIAEQILRSPAVERTLQKATGRLRFAPQVAEPCRIEIRHHLEDAAREHVALGRSPAEAERQALRELGDPWKIGVDLERAARGRRTVVFPRNRRESALQLLIYDSRVLVLIVAVIVFVRVQVVTAYHIPTKSMEPTLHGDPEDGDRILVYCLSGAPRRFELSVFDGWGAERKHFVKRTVGLPHEQVELLEGDVWIDGRLIRKQGAALDELLFPIFRLESVARRHAEVEDAERRNALVTEAVLERFDAEGPGAWQRSREHPEFLVEQPPGASEPSVLRYAAEIEDAVVDPGTGRELSYGGYDVPDVRFTVAVQPTGPATRARVRLRRGAAVFDAVVFGDVPGVALLVDGAEVARAPDAELARDRFTEVRFSQVDRVLRLELDGRLVLRHDLPEPERTARRAPRGEVKVLVEAGGAWLKPLLVERDVYWTPDYDRGRPERLGADEYFMLGDNSGNSQDSRWNGPVHESRLVGSPLWIFWPLSRFGPPGPPR